MHLFIDAVKCRIGDLCLRPSQVAGRRGDIYLGGVRGPQSLGGMHGTNLIAATAACILDRAGLVFIVPMAAAACGSLPFGFGTNSAMVFNVSFFGLAGTGPLL